MQRELAGAGDAQIPALLSFLNIIYKEIIDRKDTTSATAQKRPARYVYRATAWPCCAKTECLTTETKGTHTM